MNIQPQHSGRERKNTNNIITFDLLVQTNTLNSAAQDVVHSEALILCSCFFIERPS